MTAEFNEKLWYTIGCVVIGLVASNKRNEKRSVETLYNESVHLHEGKFQLVFNLEKHIIFDSDLYKLELIYNNDSEDDLEVHVHYRTINNNVSLENPFENFKRHIEQTDNVKILFSAPFGQGKTTFLNYFFEEQHKDQYLSLIHI